MKLIFFSVLFLTPFLFFGQTIEGIAGFKNHLAPQNGFEANIQVNYQVRSGWDDIMLRTSFVAKPARGGMRRYYLDGKMYDLVLLGIPIDLNKIVFVDEAVLSVLIGGSSKNINVKLIEKTFSGGGVSLCSKLDLNLEKCRKYREQLSNVIIDLVSVKLTARDYDIEQQIRDSQNKKDGEPEKSTTDKSSKDSDNDDSDAADKDNPEKATADKSSKDSDAADKDNPEKAEPDATRTQENQENIENIERYNQILRQTEANTATAASAATGIALILYKVGGFLYSDLGSGGSPYSGDAPAINLRVGFGLSGTPIYSNTQKTLIDQWGNDLSGSGTTEEYYANTIDMNVQYEIYPIYGESRALGFFINTSFGTGLLVQNFKAEAEYGIRGKIGSPNMKVTAEYARGSRSIFYRPWIMADENGSGGTAKINYTRVKAGAEFSWDANFNGYTRANLAIMPVFDFVDNTFNHGSNSPNGSFVEQSFNGIFTSLEFENRIKFYSEVVWDYPRQGEKDYSVSKQTVNDGLLLRIGALRCIDEHATGNYSSLNHKINQQKIRGNFALGATSNLSFIRFKDNTKSEVRSYKMLTGYGLSTSYDRKILDNLGLYLGLKASSRGFLATSTNFETVESTPPVTYHKSFQKYNQKTISIPYGVKLYKENKDNHAIWVQAGWVFNKIIDHNYWESNYGHRYPSENEAFVTEDKVDVHLENTGYMSNEVSVGMDFIVGPSKILRVGVGYEKSKTNILKGTTTNRLESINFLFALII